MSSPGGPTRWLPWRVFMERVGEVGTVLAAAATLFAFGSVMWDLPVLYPILATAFLIVLAGFAPLPGSRSQEPGHAAPERTLPDLSLAAMLEAVPDPGILLDHSGLVLDANAAAARLFPATRKGDPFTVTFRVPEMTQALAAAQAGVAHSVDFHQPGEANTEYSVLFSPVRLAGGSGTVVLVLFKDISDRIAMARMRADFVANASHELRTPLASLTGFIETLLGPARHDPEASARFLGIMLDQAQRMRRLIDDLLSLSRVEMRSNRRPAERVDLGGVLRHVGDALAPLAHDNGVVLDIAPAGAPMQVIGDRDELVQVFQNLIENAIRYGAPGGRVEIGEEPRGAARVAVQVRDYGPGIAEEHLSRLTERFYRVDVGASRDMKGTGLGLAIVKHILVRHRGQLEIRSRLGDGAQFTVDLPRAPES